MTIPHLHYTPTYPPPFLRLPWNHVSEIYILQVWVTWTLSTPLHIAYETQDICNKHQPMDHCSIQHTTSHAAKPHVSNHICNLQNRDRVHSAWSTHTNPLIPQRFWGTNPPTEGHRHSQAADTGRWARRHLHIPTPAHTDTLPSSPSHRFYSFCYIYFIFIFYILYFMCISFSMYISSLYSFIFTHPHKARLWDLSIRPSHLLIS